MATATKGNTNMTRRYGRAGSRTFGARASGVLWVLAALGCASCFRTNSQVGGETHFLACKKTADCAELGAGFACSAGRCEQTGGASSQVAAGKGDAGTDQRKAAPGNVSGTCTASGPSACQSTTGSADAGAFLCLQGSCDPAREPLVLLLVDTSGSMERRSSCPCSTPSCNECLPNCGLHEKSRWIEALEALTGTYTDYGCQVLDRTEENGRIYDLGYYLPHTAPRGDQAEDGLLDVYVDHLRIGLATFDSMDTYVGAGPLVAASDFNSQLSESAAGLWSYNPEAVLHGPVLLANGFSTGTFQYPNTTTAYVMDTGVRGPHAGEGMLLLATDPALASAVNAEIQGQLRTLWPFGGTPIAAALDDLYYYLAKDPAAEPERALGLPRYVVLITDGSPDDDYRSYDCDCAQKESSRDANYCGGPPNDPSVMHCPYPTAVEAARRLRCGDGDACDGGAVQSVYVVSYALEDLSGLPVAPSVEPNPVLDAIAAAGGTTAAHVASDGEGLRAELSAIFDQIRASP